MNIQITDSSLSSTVIGVGALPRHQSIPIISASQINGWIEVAQVFVGGMTFALLPFGIGSGDCLFDTASLFGFDGNRSAGSDNVLFVLWKFPSHPKSGASGVGRLNGPPSKGGLTGGSISWQIV
jgi:hypothetical protein